MKSKKQKQEEALARRQRDVKRWEKEVHQCSAVLSKATTDDEQFKAVTAYQAALNKLETAVNDVAALKEKLGVG